MPGAAEDEETAFSLRGVDKVSSEWNLACLAANLRRMHEKLAWV
jgi:hypothetical protein